MNEGPPNSANTPRDPLLIVISAPSGGGKTTLCQQLLARHPDLTRAITCTTRAPRPGEKEGVDYYFLDRAAFLERVKQDGFLEHATVYDKCYGTPKAEVRDNLRQRRDVLLNIDVQGAATICRRAAADEELSKALVTVFLTPRTMAELSTRLQKRGANAPDDLKKRLEIARHEIDQWKTFDYLIISTSVAEDVRRMEAIIDAETMRRERVQPNFG